MITRPHLYPNGILQGVLAKDWCIHYDNLGKLEIYMSVMKYSYKPITGMHGGDLDIKGHAVGI